MGDSCVTYIMNSNDMTVRSRKEGGDYPDRSDKDWRKLKTSAIMCAFLALGCTSATLGPSLPDLEVLYNTDTRTMSSVFTAGAFGAMAGTLLAGFLYGRTNSELQVSLACLVMGTFTMAVPWARHLMGGLAVVAIQGVSQGYIGTFAQPYMLTMWEGTKYQAPFLQGLHFVMSIGATTGPLIMRSFLVTANIHLNHTENYDIVDTSRTVLNGGSLSPTVYSQNEGNYTTTQFIVNEESPKTTTSLVNYELVTALPSGDIRLQYGFGIIGCICLMGMLAFTLVFLLNGPSCLSKRKSPVPRQDSSNATKIGTAYVLFLGLISTFYFLYVSVEATIGNLLATFVHKGLRLDKHKGASMTAFLWGAFGIGRLLGAIFSIKLKPIQILFGNALFVLSGLFLMLFATQLPEWATWLSVVLVGLGTSTVFATGLLWVAQHVKVTPFTSTLVLLSSCTGAMATPVLTGYLFQTYSHMWLVYITLGAGVLGVFVFVMLLLMVHKFTFRNVYSMTEPEALHIVLPKPANGNTQHSISENTSTAAV